MKSVHHGGYLVRDRLPISTREWKKKKTNAPHISFVSDRDKTLIWNDVLEHFTLQTDGYDDIIDGDELKERFRGLTFKGITFSGALHFPMCCFSIKVFQHCSIKNLPRHQI